MPGRLVAGLRTLNPGTGARIASRQQAIEQNAEKPSRWGQLAREGHRGVQFKGAERNKFAAVVVDGEVTFYGASKQRG